VNGKKTQRLLQPLCFYITDCIMATAKPA